MSNAAVHPLFRAILNQIICPPPVPTCHHPALQRSDEGVCCDCGAQIGRVGQDRA